MGGSGDLMDEEKFKEIDKRLDELTLRVTLAERDIKEVFQKLDKIEGNTSKIMWLIITAIILALLNSVIKGGILS